MSVKWRRIVYVGIGTDLDNLTLEVQPETLRVTFNVAQTCGREPNTVNVSIFNLSQSSRAKIQNGNILVLKAGYRDEAIDLSGNFDTAGMKPLAVADIEFVHHRHEGADWVTTIEALDGGLAYKTAYADQVIAPPANMVTVFNALEATFAATQTGNRGYGKCTAWNSVIAAARMRVTNGAIMECWHDAAALMQRWMKGITLFGWTRDIFEELCERHNLVWFFINNQLTIADLWGDVSGGVSAVTISPTGENRLIGSPERLEHGGIAFKSLLDGRLTPWSLATLEGCDQAEFNGIYKIAQATHAGDTHGGDWTTSCEALPKNEI